MDEWEKVLKSIGKSPFWFTISGGEPFMQLHLADLAIAVYKHCQPGVINIPTNSLMVDKIKKDVEKILKNCPEIQLVINLSLDGVGKKHDQIRRVPGNFEKVMQNYKNLKKIQKKYSNLTIGIHSVVSRFNVKDMPELVNFAYSLKPNQYITEIAEQRVELDTVGLNITPKANDYSKAVDYLIKKMKAEPLTGFSRITQAFRLEYYQFAKNWLKGKKIKVTDYAGWSSCEIASWGEVWPSCINGINMGNVRDHDYNFKKVWFSKKANQVRVRLRKKPESFPLANAFYSNTLGNHQILLRVLNHLFKKNEK